MKTIFVTILAISISGGTYALEGNAAVPDSSVNQEQLVDQILIISGMKKSLQNLPAQVATGFMQSALGSGASEVEQKELIGTLEKALPENVFVDHVDAALKKYYDQQRYRNYLQLLSSPLATRMLELEAQDPHPAEEQKFLAQISKHHLSPERIKLIQRLDAATQSSEMLAEMTIASLEATALAANADCSINAAKAIKGIEKQRPEIEEGNRSSALFMLAFTYRNVSDADLAAYLKIYEDKDSRWVQDIADAAIKEQYKSSVEQGAQGMKKIIQAHKPVKTMFAPKCGQSESPAEERALKGEVTGQTPIKEQSVKDKTVGQAPDRQGAEPHSNAAVPANVATLAEPAGKSHRYPVAERDLRHCLSLATSAEIIACTEK